MKLLTTGLKACADNSAERIVYYKIRHDNTSRTIATQHKIRASEWNRRTGRPSTTAGDETRMLYINKVRRDIEADLKLIENIRQQLDRTGRYFDADDIAEMFNTQRHEQNLFHFMESTAESMRNAGHRRTAETYLSAMRSFGRFAGRRDIGIYEIDNDMMQEYESFLAARGVCRNTTSFYMRIMRAAYNRAVERGLAENRQAFRRVYTGVEKTTKRAVSVETIRRIKNIDLSAYPSVKLARDMFMFSFYTRGMSFIDMAFLKKRNLRNGILSYRRQKTGQTLYVKWEKCMQDIIDAYPENITEYLLPIITNDSNPERQYLNAQHLINRKLKTITEETGCNHALTMYVARHSWASIAHRKNIPLRVISECMGHDSEKTTQIYLASLDSSEVDRANRKILDEIYR